jgi:hypothetical protein
MRISILQGSANGPAVHVENHNGITNDSGLPTLEVGIGTVVSGNFSTNNWVASSHWMRTEADPNGGTNYTISGASQLLSVPYAPHAAAAGGGGGSTSDKGTVMVRTSSGELRPQSSTLRVDKDRFFPLPPV